MLHGYFLKSLKTFVWARATTPEPNFYQGAWARGPSPSGTSLLMGGWPALLGVLTSTLGDEHAPDTPMSLDCHVQAQHIAQHPLVLLVLRVTHPALSGC